MPSNHLILCHPLLLLLSVFPRIRLFFKELVLCIRWPMYWSFINSPSNEYSGLISFRIDWCDLAVQGTHVFSSTTMQKHQNSKPWILRHSAFYMNHISHLYLTTGKNIAFTIQTFVSKVISLVFNMLPKYCHSFLSKEQPSFNFMAAEIVRSDFDKICHCFHNFSFCLPWGDGTDTLILVFLMLSKSICIIKHH